MIKVGSPAVWVVVLALWCTSCFVAVGQEKEVTGTWWLGLGMEKLNEEVYFSTVLRPEISIGKLGLGLDIVLRLDETGIRFREWENWKQAAADIIRYVRWGHKGDEFYTRVGVLRSATLGTGAIMYNYSNLRGEDYAAGNKRAGLELDMDLGEAGFELVVNDLLDPGLYGARVFVRPLQLLPGKMKVSSPVEIGVTRAADVRPGQEIAVNGVDVIWPLHPAIQPYAQWTAVQNHGGGFSLGIRNEVTSVFNYRVEFRHVERDFVPSLFNNTYENIAGMGWQAFDPSSTGSSGLLAEGRLQLAGGDLDLIACYYKSFDEIERAAKPSFTAHLQVKENILRPLFKRRAVFTASYSQQNFTDIFDFRNPRSRIEADFRMELIRNIVLEYDYRLSFSEGGTPLSNSKVGVMYGVGF